MTPRIVVLAKAPRPGRCKTRLTPPCTPDEAAALARAALQDTLDAALHACPARPLLALDGPTGDWLPAGIEIVGQPAGTLGDRIAAALAAAGGPAILIGMDTPHASASLLRASAEVLHERDAVLGLAEDGGWWALGLRAADARVTMQVPWSTPFTGRVQHRRLHTLGLSHAMLPVLRDIDIFDDAVAVAASIPSSRFAAALSAVRERLGHAVRP